MCLALCQVCLVGIINTKKARFYLTYSLFWEKYHYPQKLWITLWIKGGFALLRALWRAFKQNGVFLTIKIKLIKNNELNFFEDFLNFLFRLEEILNSNVVFVYKLFLSREKYDFFVLLLHYFGFNGTCCGKLFYSVV